MISFDKHKAEAANTWTHAISLGLFCIMAFFLLQKGWKHDSFLLNFSLIVFCISEILMFLSSTLYHIVTDTEVKRKLRYFDHCAIYISIAGSYTPILLWTIGSTLGNICFAIIWFIALAGICYKLMALGKHPKLSLAIYLAMGWLVVFIAKPVFENFPAISLWFLLAEGICFSLGTFFFWKDEEHTYYHAIWHIFIYGGCLCHWLVLWFLI